MSRNDQTSTRPNSPFAKDDRPLVPLQTRSGNWNVVRKDDRHGADGGKIVAAGLTSRSSAVEQIERQQHIVPRTDSTRRSRTRAQVAFEVPADRWERIFGGSS